MQFSSLHICDFVLANAGGINWVINSVHNKIPITYQYKSKKPLTRQHWKPDHFIRYTLKPPRPSLSQEITATHSMANWN